MECPALPTGREQDIPILSAARFSMKAPHIILFLLYISTRYAMGATFVPPATTVSDDVMLAAIADVETGNNAAKRGHHGERSQLQILPTTWREYSRLPHSAAATNPEETDRVARAYLRVIRSRLRARGLPETPFFIAAGWNAGPGWKRLHRSTVAYAERVANLVEAAEPRSPTPDLPATSPTLPVLPVRDSLNQSKVMLAHADEVPLIDIGRSN